MNQLSLVPAFEEGQLLDSDLETVSGGIPGLGTLVRKAAVAAAKFAVSVGAGVIGNWISKKLFK